MYLSAAPNPTAISSLICDEIWFIAWDRWSQTRTTALQPPAIIPICPENGGATAGTSAKSVDSFEKGQALFQGQE